jgi:hypothetical protein
VTIAQARSTVVRPWYAAAAFELAARACNAAEQIRVLDELGLEECRADAETLSGLDAWKLRRQARGLADGWPGCPTPAGALPEDALARALAAYRRWQRQPGHWGADGREALAAVHAAWLPTYVATLAGFDPAAGPLVEGRHERRL